MNQLTKILAVACVFSLSAVSARADTLVSNLGQTPLGPSTMDAGSWFGFAFKTDSSPGAFLNSVLLPVTLTSGSDPLSVFLYGTTADPELSAGTPDTGTGALASLTRDGVSDPYVFTVASGDSALSADTWYWIVAGVSGGSATYDWAFTDSSTFEVGTGFNGYAASTNGGISWSNESGFPQQAQVNTVPEPSSIALLALGSAGFLGLRLIRRRR